MAPKTIYNRPTLASNKCREETRPACHMSQTAHDTHHGLLALRPRDTSKTGSRPGNQPGTDRPRERTRDESWAVRCEVQAAKLDTRGWHHHQPVPRPVWENTGFAAIPVGRGLEVHLPGLSLPSSQGAHFLATLRRKVKSQTVQLKPTVTEPGWSF